MNTVRESAIARALNEARAEGRRMGLGPMVSHMVQAASIQCLFEGGIINKPITSN